MRTVVFSDVHGNLVALDAFLKALSYEPYDRLVFLGDAAATGPEPHRVLARLRSKDPVCVMGNTDEWLLKPIPRKEPDSETKIIEEIDSWCAKQLTGSDKDFLRTFKPTARVDIGPGSSILAYHGSPKSNREGVSPVGTPTQLDAVLLGKEATVMAGGHLHVQMLRRYGGSTLINPGSVGLPAERDHSTGKVRVPPWFEYAVVNSVGGELRIALRRGRVDPKDVAKSMSASRMPHKGRFIEAWTTVVGRLLAKENLG